MWKNPKKSEKAHNRLGQEGRLLRTRYPDDWKYYDFGKAVFRPKHMAPDELEEGVTQVYLHTTGMSTSLRRGLNTLIETRSLPVSIIGYLWNRGYGSLWVRKYQAVRNASPSRAKLSYLSHPATDRCGGEAELIQGSQERPR